MERAKVVKEEIVAQNSHFLAVYMEAKNVCFLLLSEIEDKLGTLAIAVPKTRDLPRLVSSSVMLGDKHVISARTFAEYLASKMQKIALVSVYLETTNEIQAQTIFKKLIEKVTHLETLKEETPL